MESADAICGTLRLLDNITKSLRTVGRIFACYDAAHLYVAGTKGREAAMLPSRGPVPTVVTMFEVVADGKVFHGQGPHCTAGSFKRRQELGGPPAGLLFKERSSLD
jgi:hypothetical protein